MQSKALPDGPRIYVACLAAYNSGLLHGAWIDADQSAEEIQAEVVRMLKGSPIPHAEEWAIHDSDGFGDARVAEYSSFENVARMAAIIAENDGAGLAALAIACGDLDYAESLIEEYRGEWESPRDFAAQFYSDLYGSEIEELPGNLHFYIDWDAVARDLLINDFIEEGGHYFARG